MRNYTWLLSLIFAYLCNIFSVIAAESVILIDDIIVTDEICELDNGTLTVVINNPNPGLQYSVDAGLTYQGSNYFANLSSGDYLVIVRDATACSNAFSIQIVDAPFPKVTAAFYCIQDLNKVDIILTPFADGIQPFTYSWEGPNNSTYASQNLNEVDPGEYSVTVTDRLGCEIDTLIFVPTCCSMTVSCNSLDTTRVNCIGDLPNINAAFLDNVSGDEDLNEILNLGVSINGQCSDINITVNDDFDLSGDCNDGPLLYRRIYTIDDGVTNSNCETIILVDNYKEISIEKSPEELNVSCSDNVEAQLDIWVDDLGGAIIETCSGDYTVRTEPDIYDIDYSCVGTGNIELEFIVQDECDNELRFTSEFSVSDITPPNIQCPTTLNISADDQDFDQQVSVWLDSHMSDDNCSNVIVANDYNLIGLNYECTEENLTVTFDAIDDCGNRSQCTTTIIVTQIFIPTIICPQPLIVQCDGNNNDFIINEWMGLASAIGYNNTPLSIKNDFSISDIQGASCMAPIPVRFFIDRVCLQNVDCFTTIEVVDVTPPNISCPSVLVIENGDSDYESKINIWLTETSSHDDCSQVIVDNNFNILELDFCDNDGEINVEFSAVDACDNMSLCEGVIELTPYIFTIECPDDIVIDCADDAGSIVEHWLAEGFGIENELDSLLLDNDFLLTNLNTECDAMTQVNFSIDSGCDGLATCTSIIQIIDNTAPIITCPHAITVELSSDTKEEDVSLFLGTAVAIDDCHDVILSNDWQSNVNVECSEDIAVLFVATDECDNTADCLSQVTLMNTTSPEIICPDVFYAYCDDRFLDDKIIGHLSRVEVTSSVDYNIFNDLDLDLLERNCKEEYFTDVTISAIDDCGIEISCNTILHIYPPPKVYIPNVFTPESNTADEIFTVYSNKSVTEVSSIRVYDRWGSIIFEAQNFPPNDTNYGWDGIFNNLVEKSNIMTYHVIVEGVMGDQIEFGGTIQVMK